MTKDIKFPTEIKRYDLDRKLEKMQRDLERKHGTVTPPRPIEDAQIGR